VNKKDIIKKMAEELDINQADSTEIHKAIFDELTDILTANKSLTIYGFGSFFVKRIEERQGYDLSIRKTVTLPAKNRVHFNPSDSLKEKINELNNDS